MMPTVRLCALLLAGLLGLLPAPASGQLAPAADPIEETRPPLDVPAGAAPAAALPSTAPAPPAASDAGTMPSAPAASAPQPSAPQSAAPPTGASPPAVPGAGPPQPAATQTGPPQPASLPTGASQPAVPQASLPEPSAPQATALGPLSATARVAIDRPATGATTGQRFTIMGWAADPESTGSGVDAVHVYLDGEAGRGYFVGTAEYGSERLDVAEQLGQPRFGLSGYLLQVEVAPGEHTLYVYARRRGADPALWSAPATVDVVAIADGTPTSPGRQPVSPTGCARAPDGTCLNRPSASPTCPQITPDGQCLPAAPGALPGLVGQPSGPPAGTVSPPVGPCTQYDASNRCTAYANSMLSFNLRAEGTGQMTTLSWSAVSGTATYEVLRCASATAQSCTSVAVLSGLRYQTPRAASVWFQVQARSATGQVLATSNVVGAP